MGVLEGRRTSEREKFCASSSSSSPSYGKWRKLFFSLKMGRRVREREKESSFLPSFLPPTLHYIARSSLSLFPMQYVLLCILTSCVCLPEREKKEGGHKEREKSFIYVARAAGEKEREKRDRW